MLFNCFLLEILEITAPHFATSITLCVAVSLHITMFTQPKYLTGDKESIKEFIDRFDVSQ